MKKSDPAPNAHKQIKNSLGLCLFVFILSGNLLAQSPQSNEVISKRSTFKQALNVCPIAPIFGVYALNYEYLITPRDGFLARIEYEDVPKTYTDAEIESNGIAYSINYRRHLSSLMNSFFVGAFVRYRNYKGDGEIEGTKFDFTLPSLTGGLNVGKRWAWNSGFNITVSFGYGIMKDYRKATPSTQAVEQSIDQLVKEYDFMTPIYPEVSAGYAF